MKESIRLSLALGLVCTAAAALLAFAQARTADARHNAAIRKQMAGLRRVLPEFDNQPLEDSVSCDGVTFYRARRDNRLVAVAGAGQSEKGFGGRLQVLVGLGTDGTLARVVVGAHQETPGLGTVATERRQPRTLAQFLFDLEKADSGSAQLAPNPFLDQFGADGGVVGRADQAPFRVDRDGGRIEAVSGATISSRAVAAAVTAVAEAFSANRDTICGGP